MNKSIIAIIFIALSITSCVGYDVKNKPLKQTIEILKNPIKVKGALVYFFDISQLGSVTQQCYITQHYYDYYGQKFYAYINNNGDFGGNISSIDGQNKNCAMLPYTNINNRFNRISVSNSVIEDCADFRYCELTSRGFNDKNELLGLVNPYITYSYINNSFIIQKFKDRINTLNLINPIDFTVLVYDNDLKKDTLKNLSNGNVQDISFYRTLIGDPRYVGNILYGQNGYIKLNESKFYPLNKSFDCTSRNGEIFAKASKLFIDVYDSIKNHYYQLQIPNAIGEISSYSPRYTISDDKILRINTWYKGKATEFFVNLNNGNWYRLEDLFSSLNLSQYKSLNYQLSPNGKYMLIDGTDDTTNVLAVKLSFDNGIADYLQNNVQPII